jgi:LysM repeat protein
MTNSVQRPLRVAVLLTLVVVAIVLLLASAVGASPSADAAGGSFVSYTVVAGDTLWDIAVDHIDPGDDVRRMIFDIKAANDLSDSIIRPGQELLIPSG